ncbi:MAG TPA: hypothetical protein VFC85_08535 [Verrucomicrobiae bacterium]|nr:hypothetical protein [Verrucomicrobiae bacterium]
MTIQRTESFVPLFAAPPAGESREFRVTVIPQGESSRPFQTLEQVASAAAKNISPNGKKNCEPRLTLQRDGERVTSIRIQCTCGQTMDLACVYDEPPKT